MLIRFTVSNYLSFNTSQEFSMICGKTRSKPQHTEKDGKLNLLKFAAVFGANASGKSNLTSAIEFSQSIILKGIPAGIGKDYCRVDAENKNKPSKFEYEIKIGTRYYAYGFSLLLSEGKILGEWLYEIGPNKNECIFEREPAIYQPEPTINPPTISPPTTQPYNIEMPYNIPSLNIYADSMKSNTTDLFLSEMNRNKGDLYEKNTILKPIRDVFLWFSQKLYVGRAGEPPMQKPFYIRDDFDLNLAGKIISSLGLGIANLQLEEATIDELRSVIPPNIISKMMDGIKTDALLIKKQRSSINVGSSTADMMIRYNRYFFILKIDLNTLEMSVTKLKFEHLGNHVLFDLSEESDGTQRMMDLIELLFAAYHKNDKVYVIDEVDRSLHPQLTYQLIKSYLQMVDRGNMQLIVTTHESHIMDLNLLRQDEIWFINKNRYGESEIYSLDQYNERYDRKVDKAYLDGRYGSVPIFDYYFPMNLGE